MKLELLPDRFSVCRLKDGELPASVLSRETVFFAWTDGEVSLVCREAIAPACAEAREDGWRAFRVVGILDFSLTGILARLAQILAGAQIPIFAQSTYNTDYILIREEYLDRAVSALRENGYEWL